MAKIAIGSALLVGGILGSIFAPGFASVAMLHLFILAMSTAASMGATLVSGGIAEAIADNRGMSITTKQAASTRQLIYGTHRVGGVVVYQSTTGAGGDSGNFILNQVIAIATHELDAIQNIYLDGRAVYWSQDGNPANVGCGSIPTTATSAPPTATATVVNGVVTGITATGGFGLNNVKPTRYRVRITGGGGTGAAAFATLEGGTFLTLNQNGGDARTGTWTVTMVEGGSGYTSAPDVDIQGLYTFGGVGAADIQDPSQSGFGLGFSIAPGGQHYNFAGLVFCEVRFGDQPNAPSSVMTSLQANDGNWPSTAIGNDIAYVYLNTGVNSTEFPNEPPEIRFTVNGKPLFDPRTGQTTFSSNWALQVNDLITDPVFGLGDNTVNQAQLISAANACDEEVPNVTGGESRYTQSMVWDTSSAPGDILSAMMPAAGGKISRIGGEWFIWPAVFLGPSINVDESFLVGDVTWTPTRKYRDLFNVVSGTYIAPNFPYAAVAPFSNLYDANGFWYGTRDNTFPYAWQPTNFPQYQQDALHGFASNQFLIEDGGVTLNKDLTLRGVNSVSQAQRLAKIELMRNRFQGVLKANMSLAILQAQEMDVMQFTMSQLGLNNTLLEFESMSFQCQRQSDPETGEEGAPALTVSVTANLTDPTIYEFDDTQEELTPLDLPAFTQTGLMQSTPLPPTSMTVTSSAATALISPGGTVIPRALVSWGPIDDVTVTEVDVQYQLVGATSFIDYGRVDVAIAQSFVGPLVAGSVYNFQIRSVRPPSAFSEFVQIENVTISITFPSTITTGSAQAPPGTLTAQAFSTGGASIFVAPFDVTIGGLSVDVLPAGMFTINGLQQNTVYSVYYSDPTFSGGSITPIATTNPAVFEGVTGDFLIGTIQTPSFAPTFSPTTFVVSGTASVTTPQNAFDGNTNTFASVSAITSSDVLAGPSSPDGSTGEQPPAGGKFTFEQANSACVWAGFPNVTTTTAMTLNVVLAATATGTFESASVVMSVNINGTNTVIETLTGSAAQNTYQINLTSGTDLGTMSVSVAANITGEVASTTSIFGSIIASVAEIFVSSGGTSNPS